MNHFCTHPTNLKNKLLKEMTDLSSWNKFQHENKGHHYTHEEMKKKYNVYKKKHSKPSPRKSQTIEKKRQLRKKLSPKK